MSGHWFCSCCNDVKFLRAPDNQASDKIVEHCPDCHNRSLNWILHIPGRRPRQVTQAEAAERFLKIHNHLLTL